MRRLLRWTFWACSLASPAGAGLRRFCWPRPVTIGWGASAYAPPVLAGQGSGIHPSFTWFIRIAYCWLIIAGLMSIWAAEADRHGGIWAHRAMPYGGFCGTIGFLDRAAHSAALWRVQALFSKRLMFLSLLLLQKDAHCASSANRWPRRAGSAGMEGAPFPRRAELSAVLCLH